MLYGNQKIQNEILDKVREFEKRYNKKVVFGAVIGSISKGVERYDSDYDTRFLYLDKSTQGFVRWDKIEGNIQEKQVHKCFIPGDRNCYIDGESYRNNYQEYRLEDKGLFYDKIAFWELTSYINFLMNPKLDNKFSLGLYHIVSWTFNSPFCWDPYGIKSKISCLLDEMFIPKYEIQYYKNYIQKALKKSPVMIREYLYSVYYALAIEYCIKYDRFAPVYFKSLLALCDDEKMKAAILKLEKDYYNSVSKKIEEGECYERKMANLYGTDKDRMIDNFLNATLAKADIYCSDDTKEKSENYVGRIIDIILDSLERPIVKDVNDSV